jgi:hypothetical protein
MKKEIYRIYAVRCRSGFFKTIKFISAKNIFEAMDRFKDCWGGFAMEQIVCC